MSMGRAASFIGILGLASFLAALAAGCTSTDASSAGAATGRPAWRLAAMTYTFNRFSLLEAIDKSQQAGTAYIETYAWQKIGGEHPEEQFNHAASEAALEAVRGRLAQRGIKLTHYYFHQLGTDEAESRKVFAFCRKMGIEAIICEPDPATLDLVDRLATEYRVKVAIHNHARDPNNPAYTYWNPDEVMKVLEGRSAWLGACADNGHWARSGLDSVAGVRKYEGRLISMHLKDVNKLEREAHDVPYGQGVIDLKGLLAELRRQGFNGVLSIEYEANMEDNLADVQQCVRHFRQLERELTSSR